MPTPHLRWSQLGPKGFMEVIVDAYRFSRDDRAGAVKAELLNIANPSCAVQIFSIFHGAQKIATDPGQRLLDEKRQAEQ